MLSCCMPQYFDILEKIGINEEFSILTDHRYNHGKISYTASVRIEKKMKKKETEKYRRRQKAVNPRYLLRIDC